MIPRELAPETSAQKRLMLTDLRGVMRLRPPLVAAVAANPRDSGCMSSFCWISYSKRRRNGSWVVRRSFVGKKSLN
jgi:hypothetical protein